MKAWTCMGALAALAAPGPAAAEWYGRAQVGWLFAGSTQAGATLDDGTQSVSLPLERSELDTKEGFMVGGAIGRAVLHGVRGELEVLYTDADLDAEGSVVQAYGDKVSVSSTTLFANSYIALHPEHHISPILGAGIGIGESRIEQGGVSDSREGLAWQLMAGVAYGPFEFMYRFVNPAQIEEGEFVYPGVVVEIDVEPKYHGLMVSYAFGAPR